MSLSRRQLLKNAAAAGAFSIVGLRRKSARADSPVGKKKILIVDLNGGCRNVAAFHASRNPDLNPLGLFTAQPTGSLSLSNMVFVQRDMVVNRTSTAWNQTIPGLENVAPTFAVVGAVEHAKSYTQGDHGIASLIMGTGFYDRPDLPGLFTLISKYADQSHAPGVLISGGGVSSNMTNAPGEWLRFMPIPMSFNSVPTAGSGNITATDAEDALDARVRSLRRGLTRQRLDTVIGYKQAMRRYQRLFLSPALNLSDPTNFTASFGGASPTNLQLLQAMGNLTTPSDPGHPDGANAALAIRMLEAGAPFVGVGISGDSSFDLHSDEETMAPALFARTGQILAGIHFSLTRMNMIDDVVVMVMSEFNRTVYPGAYNNAHGSDHGDGPLYGMAPTWRYQPVIAFGGGIKPKVISGTDPDTNNPASASTSATRILVTLAKLGGVPDDALLWTPNADTFWDGNDIGDGLWSLWS